MSNAIGSSPGLFKIDDFQLSLACFVEPLELGRRGFRVGSRVIVNIGTVYEYRHPGSILGYVRGGKEDGSIGTEAAAMKVTMATKMGVSALWCDNKKLDMDM